LSIQFAVRFAALFAVVSLLPVFGGAQQTTPPSKPDSATQSPSQNPAAPKDQQAPADKDKGKKGTNDNNQGKIVGTSNDRLFYALPNFLSIENTAQVPPLTTKQKFAVVARGTFDPVEVPWWGILSAIDQADNSEPAFGQGWGAFGKRYGTTAGDSLVENFLVGAVFPSVLHQDPRFFQKSQGGFGSRAWYAVTRILVTRTDSGHSQFNYSEIFGSATGAAISTFTYHPRSTFISTPTNPHMFIGSDRTLVNAADVWATQISLDTITIVVKEFWPDIHRKMSKKARQPQVDTANP
jgi:hypothetical protein